MDPVKFGKMVKRVLPPDKMHPVEHTMDAIGLSAIATVLAAYNIASAKEMQAAFLGFMVVCDIAKPKYLYVPVITPDTYEGNEKIVLEYGRVLLEKLEKGEEELVMCKPQKPKVKSRRKKLKIHS